MPLLAATGLSKRFGSGFALQDACFSVQDREVLGLIGPNGAGKTTLFECLAGFIPADSGQVAFRDAALPASARNQALFYLPDSIRPWSAQSVGGVLQFFAALHGKARGDVDELVESLRLGPFLGSRVGSLSKGEAKRVLLALGLLTPQPLLLLDEPFDGLDFRQTRDAMEVLRKIPSKGRTLFLSIHQLADAARVCDRLILLSRGQVAGEGTLAELRAHTGLDNGTLEEIFLALT